jgi:hypothetical protein
MEPDTAKQQQLIVNGTGSLDNRFERMVNGYFEGANKEDFSDAVRLFTVKDVKLYNTVKLTNSASYRYVRYMTPTEREGCNVGELKFFGKNKEELKGGIIGSQTSGEHKKENAFDNDAESYFETEESRGWVGLDLGERHIISEIHFMPRNGGGINRGEVYELFYWSGTRWQSHGKQTAIDYTPLIFQVPADAMFYLKNVTRNKGWAPFARNENGKQWWL